MISLSPALSGFGNEVVVSMAEFHSEEILPAPLNGFTLL